MFVCAGRKERKYSTFTVSPDNKFLAFLGKDGYIIFVSNKVCNIVGEQEKGKGVLKSSSRGGISSNIVRFIL